MRSPLEKSCPRTLIWISPCWPTAGGPKFLGNHSDPWEGPRLDRTQGNQTTPSMLIVTRTTWGPWFLYRYIVGVTVCFILTLSWSMLTYYSTKEGTVRFSCLPADWKALPALERTQKFEYDSSKTSGAEKQFPMKYANRTIQSLFTGSVSNKLL